MSEKPEMEEEQGSEDTLRQKFPPYQSISTEDEEIGTEDEEIGTEDEEMEIEDDIRDLPGRWVKLMGILEARFGKKLSLEGILFLIGVRELGESIKDWSKEEKTDLMHIAICAVFAPSGYFKLSHLDQEGWPHWEQVKELPFANIFSQEVFLKSHIVDYFAEIYEI